MARPTIWTSQAVEVVAGKAPTRKLPALASVIVALAVTLVSTALWLAPAPVKAQAQAQAQARNRIEQWKIGGGTGPVLSGHRYSLRNDVIDKYLIYGDRSAGINLVWANTDDGRSLTFRKQSGDGPSLRYGDSVAVHVRGGGYLMYRSRPFGINLVWSAEPKYEWRITGGRQGTVVPLGTLVGLYNTREPDHVVYCEREFGINLKWADDCNRI
jgi:hypothetical protein